LVGPQPRSSLAGGKPVFPASFYYHRSLNMAQFFEAEA
jgi:hypothetical protein